MTTPAQHSDYPLTITDDESRSGFEQWLVFRIVDEELADLWTPVVCKVLGSSDIIVKVNLFGDMYSHRRYGWMYRPKKLPPKWSAVGMPYNDLQKATFETAIGASEVGNPYIETAAAQMKKA